MLNINNKDNLKYVEKAPVNYVPQKEVKQFTPNKKVNMSLDLRGHRYE